MGHTGIIEISQYGFLAGRLHGKIVMGIGPLGNLIRMAVGAYITPDILGVFPGTCESEIAYRNHKK